MKNNDIVSSPQIIFMIIKIDDYFFESLLIFLNPLTVSEFELNLSSEEKIKILQFVSVVADVGNNAERNSHQNFLGHFFHSKILWICCLSADHNNNKLPVTILK